MMRAVRALKPGGAENLSIVQEAIPQLKSGQILLKISATAVNRADINQRQGNYPPPPGITDILGLEASGRVHEIGPECKGKWKIGDQVMALVSGGAYAEYVAVKEDHLLPKPPPFTSYQAAAIPEAWLTAYQLLSKVGNIRKGESVLIHAGASGVGTAAIQLVTKLYSGVVFATAGSEDKLDFLRNLGAQHVFNYNTGSFVEFVKQGTNGRGVDVVLDCIGASYWKDNSDCIATDGRWVLYGLMGGKVIDGDLLGRILAKRIRIQGSTLRTRSDEYKTDLIQSFANDVMPGFTSGRLLPIVHQSFPLDDVIEAHKSVEQNLNIGKVILTVESEGEYKNCAFADM